MAKECLAGSYKGLTQLRFKEIAKGRAPASGGLWPSERIDAILGILTKYPQDYFRQLACAAENRIKPGVQT
jgi:hypothetical protein